MVKHGNLSMHFTETSTKDPRNVRLGLSSYGFNPFGNMITAHSTWPVLLVLYNFPPWMCMKQPYFMLSLIIPGPSLPGMNIDVYLQPLIAELNQLWDVGVQTFDASLKKKVYVACGIDVDNKRLIGVRRFVGMEYERK